MALRWHAAAIFSPQDDVALSIHPCARTPAIRIKIARSAAPAGALAKPSGGSIETSRK
ncbi:hypothetical protein [Microvirga sp. VF16]|uniref:hypothetical protein n=1 Tax=Microvirga sp. VF16 TaxID=2807101 RepID=UPI00193D40BF|nr:hypothetical protein [Microvirga sp. VF16]QRM28265.1 hypothetical protein JO965_18765 [Microvirga sp. VF16]